MKMPIWFYQRQYRLVRCMLFMIPIVVLCVSQAGAQYHVSLYPPDLSEYPLVKLPIQIKDNTSRLTNLSTADFSITENGVPRTPLYIDCVNDTAWEQITFLFVLDVSHSMEFGYGTTNVDTSYEKWKAAKSALATVVDAMRPEDAGVLYALYASLDRVVSYTKDPTILKSSIDQLAIKYGTKIFDAIVTALNDASGLPGRMVMVLITDGDDQRSNATIDEAIAAAQAMTVPVYIIGLDVTILAEVVLRQIANQTGGKYYYAPSTSVLQESIKDIASSVYSGRCILAYETDDTCRDGRERNIDVTVSIPPEKITVSEMYTLPDEQEHVFVSLGTANTQYQDETDVAIPFAVTGYLSAINDLDLTADIRYDPTVLEYKGIVQGGGIANIQTLTVDASLPGVVHLSGLDMPLSEEIPANETRALFSLLFTTLYQDSIVTSTLEIDNVSISHDCPVLSTATAVSYTVQGCLANACFALDSTVIAPSGGMVDIPVYLESSVDLQQLLEFGCTLRYDTTYLTYASYSLDGTVAEEMNVSVTETQPGTILVVAGAGYPAMRSGVLMHVQFDVSHQKSSFPVSVYLEDASLEQSCIPQVQISGNSILLDGMCDKIVRRSGFGLGQNIPNPVAVTAGKSTDIPFRVSGNERVTLIVYTIDGTEIAVLVDEYLESGEYSVRFSPSGLPAGTYMCVLRQGDAVLTRKIVLR